MKTRNSEMDDSVLVQMFRDGDSKALGIIFERYKSGLKLYIFKIVGNKMLADDILQDIFEKTIEILKNGEYIEHGTFKSLLFTMAHNSSINYVRKYETRNTITSAKMLGAYENLDYGSNYLNGNCPQNPEEIMIEAETEYDIHDLLNKLPPEQKEVVILRIFHNLKFREIAEFTNCPSITNRTRMHYALINLRKLIEDIKNDGKQN
jgi:RNA polymerase sigma factor (sigma-70 family)